MTHDEPRCDGRRDNQDDEDDGDFMPRRQVERDQSGRPIREQRERSCFPFSTRRRFQSASLAGLPLFDWRSRSRAGRESHSHAHGRATAAGAASSSRVGRGRVVTALVRDPSARRVDHTRPQVLRGDVLGLAVGRSSDADALAAPSCVPSLETRRVAGENDAPNRRMMSHQLW